METNPPAEGMARTALLVRRALTPDLGVSYSNHRLRPQG